MAYSLIANVAAGSTGGGAVTTAGINTTGANLIVVSVGWFQNAMTVSDSNTNTWSALTLHGELAAKANKLFYVFNPTVGAGHTFTADGGASAFPALSVSAWSGSTSTPFDVENGASGSAATLATGSITPAQDNELIIAGLVHDNNTAGAVSIDSTMTITDSVAYSGSNHMGESMAYKIQTTAAAINPTWNITNSAPLAASIASFKASAGGGGGGAKMLAALGVG